MAVDKIITSIVETGSVLLKQTKEAIEQDIIEDKECPFCGAPYDEREILKEKILLEEEKLL